MLPPDADLQDFPFMPLHVARLRDSDLAAEGDPEGCWYAVLLWAASWHQLPAGSLPDNDAVLTKLCGLGRDVRTFRKHRGDALRGFVLCSDGRLYHPVVAEQALAAWESKLRQRHRTECATIKKRNDRNKTRDPRPSFAEWLSLNHPSSVPHLSLGTDDVVPRDVPDDYASKRQGEGQGQGDLVPKAEASGAAEPPPAVALVPIAASVPPALPADPAKVMFDSGIRLLAAAGKAEGAARSLLGKWKNTYGAEAVIVALGKAQREGAVDPQAYVEGVLRNGNRSRTDRPSAWSNDDCPSGAEPFSLDDRRSARFGG